jgi:two-component system sensor kinase FixL
MTSVVPWRRGKFGARIPLRRIAERNSRQIIGDHSMFESGQSRVVKLLADGAPTVDLLAALCHAIEQHGTGALASILILDRDGRRLRHGAAPSLPGDFNRAIDGVEIGDGALAAAIVLERDRMEDALRRGEERFRDNVAATSDWIWEMDADLRVSYVSGHYFDIVGTTPEDIIGKKRSEMPPALPCEEWETYLETLEAHRPYKGLVFSRVPRDGSMAWFSSSDKPVFDADGRFTGYRCATSDVTARVVAERELLESEERDRTLVDLSPDAIGVIDGTRLVFANRAYAAIHGADRPEQLVDGNILDLIHADERDAAGRRLSAAFEGRPSDAKVVRRKRLRLDGTEFATETATAPIMWRGRRRVLGIVRDVTERERADDALRESEDRYRSLVELSPDGVMVHSDGVVTFANASLARILGMDAPDRIVGVSAIDFVPADDRAVVVAPRNQALRETNFEFRETSALRPDGSTIPVERAGACITWRGKPSFLVIVRDITERREAERKAQEQAENLAQIQRLNTIGQLSSALAHEVNQPLFAAMGFVEVGGLALQSGDADGVVKARDLMAKAATQLDRAGGIIRRLGSFVEKRRSAHLEEDINEVAEAACSIALIGAREMDVRVTLDLDDDLPPVVIDRIQIEQVLLNLVRNALGAMRDRTEREPRIRTSPLGDGVLAAITDTGAGLADEMSARLLEPFVTTKEGAMGVGLSISRSIVEAHGGTVWATSHSAGGTTFSFTLKASLHARRETVE